MLGISPLIHCKQDSPLKVQRRKDPILFSFIYAPIFLRMSTFLMCVLIYLLMYCYIHFFTGENLIPNLLQRIQLQEADFIKSMLGLAVCVKIGMVTWACDILTWLSIEDTTNMNLNSFCPYFQRKDLFNFHQPSSPTILVRFCQTILKH